MQLIAQPERVKLRQKRRAARGITLQRQHDNRYLRCHNSPRYPVRPLDYGSADQFNRAGMIN